MRLLFDGLAQYRTRSTSRQQHYCTKPQRLETDLVTALQLAQISIAVKEGFRNFQPLIFNLRMAEV